MFATATIPFTHFELPPQIIVIGVVTGLIYGLLGVGLTLTYRSARVINFAHGEVGALCSGVMAFLVLKWHVPYAVGLLGALATALIVGAALELLVIRRLSSAPRLVVMVATIGASQVLLAANAFIPRLSYAAKSFPTPFHVTVTIGGVRLQAADLLILTVVPICALGLAAFLRRSKIGLGARASADNLEAARLAGVPARRISLVVWVLAAVFAMASAVLVAPTRPLIDASNLGGSLGPSLMVRALAAALLGGLVSLPQVLMGGVAIGLVEVLVSWNYPTGGAIDLVMFAAIILSILVRRELSRPGRGSDASTWSLGGAVHALEPVIANLRRVRLAKRGALAALLLAAVLIPVTMTSSRLVLLSTVVLFALMGLSVTMVTGFTGQVSLGQMTFVALGAVVGGRMFQLGYPAWEGILYATAAGGIAAAAVGLPALRLRGLLLAITTLSFAVAANAWIPRQGWLVVTKGSETSLELPRQTWFGVGLQRELHYYWLCLVVLVAVAFAIHRLRRSGVGRSFMGVRDNELAAATLSVAPQRAKLIGFILSGMIAAFAGYFYGGLLVNFAGARLFDPTQSLALLAMVIFGGVTTITGCILGALWIVGIPYFLGKNIGILSSGLGVVVVLQVVPGGLSSLAMRIRDRAVTILTGVSPGALRTSVRAEGAPRQRLAPAPPRLTLPESPPLSAEDIVVRFGGVTAVDHVSFEARRGEIVGLVGPNGAGKTTLFDVLSGQTRPSSGRVLLHGDDVSALRPHDRALRGLGRSFQEARLFPDLALIDAFKLALEATERAELVPSLLGLPASRASERAKQQAAEQIVELLGLTTFAHRNCGELSTGTRRFAELGMMLAMGSDVILLDEPTAGIAQREVEAFTPVLREIRDHLDATMVVIDHDIPMLTGLVDRLYVMAAGQVIAQGSPSVVRDDPAVVAAYLGTDERVIQRSGAVDGVPSSPPVRQA